MHPQRRKDVLDRDGHKCVTCGAESPLEVHHKIHVKDEGSDELDNLETLCSPCHHGRHRDTAARLVIYSYKRRIQREQEELAELYDRFIAALYGQENFPCTLEYGILYPAFGSHDILEVVVPLEGEQI